MKTCSLCPAPLPGGARGVVRVGLTEHNERREPVRVEADLRLCQRCTNVMWKHLKRHYGKRPFHITPAGK